MARYLWTVTLLAAICLMSAFPQTALAKEKQVVHRLVITGQEDLVFREGDNPCKVLKRYCKSLKPQFNYESCFSQLHPAVIQQLSLQWDKVRNKLKTDESFFIDCDPLNYNRNDFSPGVTVVSQSPTTAPAGSIDTRNSSGIITEMLTYLKRAMEMDAAALQTFNTRRNELKLTDTERIDLYRKALLLLPNNLFIVDQFGLALMYIDMEAPARKLFSHAVSRGLWGNPLQRPVSKYVPGLTSLPWHNKVKYPFIARLEEGYKDIKAELLMNLKERRHLFTEEAENLHVGGDWTEVRLKSSGLGFLKTSEYFPKTMSHIEGSGQEYTSIKFSAIQPGTHIRTHTGPTNERLRIHLTLMHTGGARIRVGTEWHTWEEGKAIIFDDSWEHEVIHTGESIRAVLILDIWHPELPPSQRIVH